MKIFNKYASQHNKKLMELNKQVKRILPISSDVRKIDGMKVLERHSKYPNTRVRLDNGTPQGLWITITGHNTIDYRITDKHFEDFVRADRYHKQWDKKY